MINIESLLSVLGATTVAPPLFYLISLTLIDNKPEPPLVIIGSFLLGAISIVLLQFILPDFVFAAEKAILGISPTFSEAFIEVAAPEELIKSIILILFCRPFIANRHPIEAVVYGAAVGLGFAAAENLSLMIHRPWDWGGQFIIRSILTVPLHGALGVIAGLMVYRAHFIPTGRARRWGLYALSWVYPMLLHGLYDFPLLLALDWVNVHNPLPRTLRTIGCIIGLSVIVKAATLIYRTAESQYTRPGPYSAARPSDARYWRLHTIGGLSSLIGALMVLIETQNWIQGKPFALDRPLFILIGTMLVAIATFHHHKSANAHHLHNTKNKNGTL